MINSKYWKYFSMINIGNKYSIVRLLNRGIYVTKIRFSKFLTKLRHLTEHQTELGKISSYCIYDSAVINTHYYKHNGRVYATDIYNV